MVLVLIHYVRVRFRVKVRFSVKDRVTVRVRVRLWILIWMCRWQRGRVVRCQGTEVALYAKVIEPLCTQQLPFIYCFIIA